MSSAESTTRRLRPSREAFSAPEKEHFEIGKQVWKMVPWKPRALALWPLATSHCSLEQMPGLEFLACADEAAAVPHQGNDCETDSCASVESGFYKSEDGHQVVPTAPLVASALLTAILRKSAQPVAGSRIVFDSAPPELPKVWQFSFRTALPPRAPSFV